MCVCSHLLLLKVLNKHHPRLKSCSSLKGLFILLFSLSGPVWGHRGSFSRGSFSSTEPPRYRPLPPLPDDLTSLRYPKPPLSFTSTHLPSFPAVWVSHGSTSSSRVPLAEPGPAPQRPCLPHAVWAGRTDVHAGGLRCCGEALLSHGSILTWGKKPMKAVAFLVRKKIWLDWWPCWTGLMTSVCWGTHAFTVEEEGLQTSSHPSDVSSKSIQGGVLEEFCCWCLSAGGSVD